jgi:cardiolipin synthase
MAGAPLQPWTLPNLIGYARLAGIPAFLVVGLSAHRGQSVLAAIVFAVIGWSDYLDGFVARLTGQYSRLGALLDPVIDRLLILSGVAVVWRFALLPRWALALVIAREALVLALSRYGIKRGVELRINWFGRIGVAPTMGAPFFAILGLHTVALVMLYWGLTMSLAATVAYVRTGWQQLGAGKQASAPPGDTPAGKASS